LPWEGGGKGRQGLPTQATIQEGRTCEGGEEAHEKTHVFNEDHLKMNSVIRKREERGPGDNVLKRKCGPTQGKRKEKHKSVVFGKKAP